MIIRATQKVLKTNKIKPQKKENESTPPLPGEWFVDVVSQGRPGKLALHFMHHPTLVSIIVPGKSLTKGVPIFIERLERLLERHDMTELTLLFQASGEPMIASTNSRRMLGLINSVAYTIEYHLYRQQFPQDILLNYIEDILIFNLYGKAGQTHLYEKPIENLLALREE